MPRRSIFAVALAGAVVASPPVSSCAVGSSKCRSTVRCRTLERRLYRRTGFQSWRQLMAPRSRPQSPAPLILHGASG